MKLRYLILSIVFLFVLLVNCSSTQYGVNDSYTIKSKLKIPSKIVFLKGSVDKKYSTEYKRVLDICEIESLKLGFSVIRNSDFIKRLNKDKIAVDKIYSKSTLKELTDKYKINYIAIIDINSNLKDIRGFSECISIRIMDINKSIIVANYFHWEHSAYDFEKNGSCDTVMTNFSFSMQMIGLGIGILGLILVKASDKDSNNDDDNYNSESTTDTNLLFAGLGTMAFGFTFAGLNSLYLINKEKYYKIENDNILFKLEDFRTYFREMLYDKTLEK